MGHRIKAIEIAGTVATNYDGRLDPANGFTGKGSEEENPCPPPFTHLTNALIRDPRFGPDYSDHRAFIHGAMSKDAIPAPLNAII